MSPDPGSASDLAASLRAVGSTRSVGASAPRVEDIRILSGTGRYVDDLVLPGMLHAAFVRSPIPHGRITGVDVSAAAAVEGVVAIYTGADFAQRTNSLGPAAAPPDFRYERFYPLAVGKVRLVGDPVAIVVATDRASAEDGAELVVVDYDQLDGIATFEQALAPDGPPIFEELGSNIVLEADHSYGDVEASFAAADRVIRETFSQHRVAHVPMEGLGGVAAVEAGMLTYYTGTQSPHSMKGAIAESLGLPPEQVRSVNGDIGGAFGLKIVPHREDLAVCAAAHWLGRPVKWIEDRNEHLVSSGQAREARIELEAAVRDDGTILGLRGDLLVDQGAYPSFPITGGGIVAAIASWMSGPYAFQSLAMHSRVVASNKATLIAYRAPWAMETWARERMLDVVARELDLDPAEVRRRNFAPNDGSASMLSGPTLLDNACEQSLERALDEAGYASLRDEQARARAQGRCVGVGFATFLEAAPGPAAGRAMAETAYARLDEDGTLCVYTTQAPHGQSHETTLAQIASDEFGVPMESVRVYHGDTSNTPYALVGTGGSRAATMASGSVLKATRRLKERILDIAGALLEANPADLLIENGFVHPAGVPSVGVGLAEVAEAARARAAERDFAEGAPAAGASRLPADLDLSLAAEETYDGGVGSWTSGTHLVHVEIDLATGLVDILRYLVVEDCGRMINPAIVEGQIRGGVAQGVGEVLYEWAAYDDDANFLAGTFMDYLLPTASEVPPIDIVHLEIEPNEEVAYRGVGEGGLLVAPAAITNAIEDALSPYGARVREDYLPPAAILRLAGLIDA